MKRILIICAGSNYNNNKLIEYIKKSDYIICADAGYNYALENNILPDFLVGDFDSMENPENFFKKIHLPKKKDETDSLYALKMAFSKMPSEIVIYAALGTRFDHSYANVCLLNMCLESDIKAVVTDGINRVYLIDSEMTFENEQGTTVSIYSFSDVCEEVSIKGFEYPLDNYNLLKYDIIGTSNIINEKIASIKLKNGKLMIVCN